MPRETRLCVSAITAIGLKAWESLPGDTVARIERGEPVTITITIEEA
jgi:hypothetical protein